MSRTSLRATSALLSAVTVAALAGIAGPASAKDAPAPSPEPVLLDCFGDFGDPTIPAMTAPDVAVNYAGDAGCVGVRVTPTSVRLAWVVLAPNWRYAVRRNGGGTQARVELRFTNTATGERLDFRYQQGRTTIG
jgi:hypothetical protein